MINAVVEVDNAGAIVAVHDRSTSEGATSGRAALDTAAERVDLEPRALS